MLNSITCVTDGSQYCILDPNVDLFLDSALDKMRANNSVDSEAGSALFCDNECVNVLAPTILQTTRADDWKDWSNKFEKGCYEHEDDYCLGLFLLNDGKPGTDFEQACKGQVDKKLANTSTCPEACKAAFDTVIEEWGCCLGEWGTEQKLVGRAETVCEEKVFKCEGGGVISFQLDVPNLRYSWMRGQWRKAVMKLAIETDIAKAVNLPEAQVTFLKILSFAGGCTFNIEIVTQTDAQSRRIMNRLQGVTSRRAALSISLDNTANRIVRAALVDPRQGLLGQVDVISIVATGSANRYRVLPTLEDAGSRAAPGALPLLASSLLLLLLSARLRQ